MKPIDDLKHQSDCWDDDDVLPMSPKDQEARYYAKMVRDVKEKLGVTDLDRPIRRQRDNDSDY